MLSQTTASLCFNYIGNLIIAVKLLESPIPAGSEIILDIVCYFFVARITTIIILLIEMTLTLLYYEK